MKEMVLLEKALSVYATPDGKIWVASKGNVYEAVSQSIILIIPGTILHW